MAISPRFAGEDDGEFAADSSRLEALVSLAPARNLQPHTLVLGETGVRWTKDLW